MNTAEEMNSEETSQDKNTEVQPENTSLLVYDTGGLSTAGARTKMPPARGNGYTRHSKLPLKPF